ncbi:DUF3106 domain-containing protein [Limnohabitans sp.]|jgi:hypothetical protein|uniref:DUF3106 domain-containing protein n=1 Tax=Limnohabitans sp. TaxID=1907725 RepID=UPI00286F2002|nr:DUF3106 domain-containing protein [Limnohabitans sp.]
MLSRAITAKLAALLLLSSTVLFDNAWVYAQTSSATVAKTAPSLPGRPLWMDLTESQQQALSPLSQLWPTMNEPHKRKWLAISQNFAQLSADEQNTLQSRMREWAALSPQQRTAARLNFAGAQQLPQEDKKAKWEAYQALSPEAKQKLAARQNQPVLGAAPAVKPVASTKLTTSPAASSNKTLPRIATDQVAPATLLPTPVITTIAPVSPASESTATPQ